MNCVLRTTSLDANQRINNDESTGESHVKHARSPGHAFYHQRAAKKFHMKHLERREQTSRTEGNADRISHLIDTNLKPFAGILAERDLFCISTSNLQAALSVCAAMFWKVPPPYHVLAGTPQQQVIRADRF
jgi:hypothetical protein